MKLLCSDITSSSLIIYNQFYFPIEYENMINAMVYHWVKERSIERLYYEITFPDFIEVYRYRSYEDTNEGLHVLYKYLNGETILVDKFHCNDPKDMHDEKYYNFIEKVIRISLTRGTKTADNVEGYM